MADAPPVPPASVPPAPPQAIPSVQLSVPSEQPIHPAHVPKLNWSNFKPKFAGKPDEDMEAPLLRMNDWMDTHRFQEDVKVQCFV